MIISFILCVSVPNLQIIFLFQPLIAFIIFVHSFSLQWLPNFILLGTSAHPTFGPCLHFSEISTMTRDDLTHPVAAAATAQVKLCPYNEEELTSGSASSRPNSQWQASDHKNSSMGSPVDTRLHPWLTVKPVGCTPVTLYSVCI